MTAEKLDSVKDENYYLSGHFTCGNDSVNNMKCNGKLKIYYINADTSCYPAIERLCKKHFNVIVKGKWAKEIIELSNKDILYLKITGKL